MVAAMTAAMAMATLPAAMLHSTPSSTCNFPRSNMYIVVASRRVAAAASGSEAAEAPPASSVEEDEGPNLPCGTCNSKGWLVCDFCKGQKTNVQVRANKFYRRCPSCRAVSHTLFVQTFLFVFGFQCLFVTRQHRQSGTVYTGTYLWCRMQ